MAKKLTPKQLEIRNAWIHDILVWNNVINTKRSWSTGYMYDNRYGNKNAAQIVYLAIKARPVDYNAFTQIDLALTGLSNEWFSTSLTDRYARATRKAANILADYVASFCADLGLYWDDDNSTEFEKEEYKKTIIGTALYDFGCFVSQPEAKTRVKSTKTSTTAAAPASGYKASGGQSSNILNLVGTPGNKITLTNWVYCIEADKIGKNVPNAFVKPLHAKANNNGTNEVFFGSGNGYTDCRCWIDDYNVAQGFLTQVVNKFGNKYNNIRIAKGRPDNNGYFEVSTEFGNCYIKASKMNEEFEADANTDSTLKAFFRPEKLDKIQKADASIKLDDIEAFEEAFTRELA